jgi:hypothetical protein
VSNQIPSRPKNVVVVDAENPMVEVAGEFFWREDHDAIVAAARDAAYRDGYFAGWTAASSNAAQHTVGLRSRPAFRVRLARMLVGATILLGAVALLVAAILDARSR